MGGTLLNVGPDAIGDPQVWALPEIAALRDNYTRQMQAGSTPRLCVMLTVVLAGCSLPLPTNEASVTAPRGDAPGHCAEVTEFAYVGVSTLRDLGFDDTFGDDFERRGRFWVTAEPLDVRGRAAQQAAQQAEAARAREGS